MRPLGALVLGAYIDRQGRRKGLMLTLLLMAIGTLTMAITPKYETIGLAAPLIVLAGRLLQGFSAGVELGGVSVYLSEIATAGNRGFYTSWQSASQQAAVVFTAVIGHCPVTAIFKFPDERVWLARTVSFGLPDYPGASLAAQFTRRNRGVSQRAALWFGEGNLAPGSSKLAADCSWHDALGADNCHVLSDHGLHADFRQDRASSVSQGRVHRDPLRGSFQFCLAAGRAAHCRIESAAVRC